MPPGSDPFSPFIEAAARQFCGSVNERLSSETELRFGTNGSLSVAIGGPTKGVWFNHETGAGGGVLDLLRLHGRMETVEALDWLRQHGAPLGNGHAGQANGRDTHASGADRRSRIVAEYDYHDENGALLYQVVRFEPKDFRQRRPNETGWTWNLQGVRRVPYRLPTLLAAFPGDPVYIVEGEKDADSLHALGLVATCNAGGAAKPGQSSKWPSDFAAYFQARDVVILPDNDEAGEAHALTVATGIAEAAASVRIVRLPDLPPKDDVSDWLAAGGTVEALRELIEATPMLDRTQAEAGADASGWADDGDQRDREEPPFFSFNDQGWDEAAIAPRPWIAPGYLLRGAITAVIGPGAAGKSSLLVAWAVALAFGIDLDRFRPRHAVRVLLLNTEDGEDEQRRRLTAALARVGLTPADLAGKIGRVSAERFSPLLGKDETGAVDVLPAMRELDGFITLFAPDVVVLDPLIDLHTVEENANVEMREVMTHLRSLAAKHNISVVVAHHTRKGTITPGDSDAARGASAIRDLARVAVTVTPMSEEDAEAFGTRAGSRPFYFRLDDAKVNYAPLGQATWFERISHLLANGDHVAAAHPWTPPDDAVSVEQRAKIEAGLADGCDGEAYSPKLDEALRSFARLCARHGVEARTAQKKLLADLLAAGFSKAKFRKRDRNVVLGIRTPDGTPNVPWLDDEEEAA